MSTTTFLAIYRGATISDARLVAVSADPKLVAEVAARLLEVPPDPDPDPVTGAVEHGRRAALRLVREELSDGYE